MPIRLRSAAKEPSSDGMVALLLLRREPDAARVGRACAREDGQISVAPNVEMVLVIK